MQTNTPGSTIATDLLCWDCRYNLRTLPEDGACPECGYSVAETVRLRGQQRRAFTVDTLPWWVRMGYVVFGVVLPVMAFGLLEVGGGGFVEWQSGDWYNVPALLLSAPAARPFYPVLLFAAVCLMMLMGDPARSGRQWAVAIGCGVGIVLGVHYAVVMLPAMVAMSHGHYGAADSFAFGGFLLTAGFMVTNGLRMLAAWRWPDDRFPSRFKTVEAFSAAGALIVCIVSVVIFPLGIWFSPVLFGLACASGLTRFVATWWFDRRDDRARPAQRGVLLAAVGSAVAYVAAWPLAVLLAIRQYHTLPTDPPVGCYVCTAAARGHPWLVRSVPTRLADGTVMRVNRQMRVLKAFEHLLRDQTPWLHRALRAGYDAVGPRLAARVRSPWSADLAYLVMAGPALLASAILTVLGCGARVRAAYRAQPKRTHRAETAVSPRGGR